jgi:hypothetical protein
MFIAMLSFYLLLSIYNVRPNFMHNGTRIKGIAIGNKVKLSDGTAIQTLNDLHTLTSQAKIFDKRMQGGTYQISQTVISSVIQSKDGRSQRCVCGINIINIILSNMSR